MPWPIIDLSGKTVGEARTLVPDGAALRLHAFPVELEPYTESTTDHENAEIQCNHSTCPPGKEIELPGTVGVVVPGIELPPVGQ